jgi:nucleoid-associated protein YgaU
MISRVMRRDVLSFNKNRCSIKKEKQMGLFSFIKEAGEKLFGTGEAKAAEQVAKKRANTSERGSCESRCS